MNYAGGERGNGLTLFATGLLECSGNACGGEGAKQDAGEINGKYGGTGFKSGDWRAGIFMQAYGGLGPSAAVASFLKIVNAEG